ncbi:MAG: glutamate--tRNA ligase [Phycisphaerales bacterium]
MSASDQVVTRFAPSPTGHLHIGGARTALFCWAYARKRGGRFMIRIEDTDQARSSDESARGILDDLAWLGIEWDDGPSHAVTASDVAAGGGGRVIGASCRDVGSAWGPELAGGAGYFQARRLKIYNAYIEHLVRAGRAYPAFETAAELDALRKAATAAKQTFKYPRPADVVPGVFNETRWERALAGAEPHVIRFVVDGEDVVVRDEVLGEGKFAAGEVDDFVIRKADGFPTYHFAVVIDDELMGVTHVLRAQEHLNNTPRHVALQRALTRLAQDGRAGTPFRTPVYAHMPLIFNPDGAKMSKRDKAKSARKAAKEAIAKDPSLTPATLAGRAGLDAGLVAGFLASENDSLEVAAGLARLLGVSLPEIDVWDFRKSGYLPEAITNFIALLGWSPGMKESDGRDVEKFDTAFLAQHFDLSRIGRTNARFDRVKLLSFNADLLQSLSDERFLAAWSAWLAAFEPAVHARLASVGRAELLLLAAAIKQRCKVLRDSLGHIAMFLCADADLAYDRKAIEKFLLKAGEDGQRGVDHLRAVREVIAGLGAIDSGIGGELERAAAGRGVAMGAIAQPLRVAVSGGGVSPPIDLTLRILGKASTLARIDRCLGQC